MVHLKGASAGFWSAVVNPAFSGIVNETNQSLTAEEDYSKTVHVKGSEHSGTRRVRFCPSLLALVKSGADSTLAIL